MRSPGFVYVMTNPRLPGVVKVGKTTRPPEDSAREGAGAGTGEILHVRDAAYFSDYDAAESFVHEYLATFRDPAKTEYFEVPVEIAMRALSLAMERHVGTRTARQHDPSLYDNEPAPDSSHSASELYEQGVACRAQNPAEAMQVFKRAARKGESRAFIALAEMYERGEGITPDPKRGIEWLEEGTRSNARECWGALADRYGSTGAGNPASYAQARSCVRSYFEGMDLVSISDDHLAPALARMRLYLKVAKMQMDPQDERLIPKTLDGIRSRVQHHTNESARRSLLVTVQQLSKEWLVVSGKKKSAGIGIGALLTGTLLLMGVAIFVVPTAKQIFFKPQAPEETADAPADKAKAAAAEGESKDSASTSKTSAAKPKAKQQAKAKAAVRAAAPDRPGKPIIRDAAPDTPAPATSWVIKTPPPAPEAPPKERLSAQQLADHFEVNKERATAAFKNETVRIADVITKVGKHDVSFKKVKCKLDGAPPSGLEPGQSVTVEGVVHGKGFWTGNVTLDRCRILQ